MLDERQLIDGAILSGGWEPKTTAAVRRLVKPGMTVVDAGANIGWFAVLLSRIVGPSGRVLACEPMGDAFAVMAEHVRLNGCANVDARRIALDREDGEHDVLFNFSWEADHGGVEQRSETITCRRLDSMGIGRVDFLKIDTDGFEARLIEGARETLSRWHPTMVLEVCDYTLASVARAPYGLRCYAPRGSDYAVETRRMLGLLSDLGYRFLWEDTFEPATVDAMCGNYDLSTTGINAICVHGATWKP